MDSWLKACWILAWFHYVAWIPGRDYIKNRQASYPFKHGIWPGNALDILMRMEVGTIRFLNKLNTINISWYTLLGTINSIPFDNDNFWFNFYFLIWRGMVNIWWCREWNFRTCGLFEAHQQKSNELSKLLSKELICQFFRWYSWSLQVNVIAG